MMKRCIVLVLLLSVLFVQGCDYIVGAAVSAAAAYGISKAFD